MKLIYTGNFERLKEFGFWITTDENFHCRGNYGTDIYVRPISREITYRADFTENIPVPSVIYDLIQAGLVKKEKQ